MTGYIVRASKNNGMNEFFIIVAKDPQKAMQAVAYRLFGTYEVPEDIKLVWRHLIPNVGYSTDFNRMFE